MSDKWICQGCGEVIGVGEFETERSSVYVNDRPDLYLENDKCPFCGGCEFEDTERCHGCGGYFVADELDEDDLCAECQKYETSYKSNYKKGEQK